MAHGHADGVGRTGRMTGVGAGRRDSSNARRLPTDPRISSPSRGREDG